MTFVHDQIRDHIYETKGLGKVNNIPSLEELKETEWSSKFEKLMRNRLILGAIRYGELNKPGKNLYNRIDSIRQRLSLYEETGNAEHLVDCANLCLCEFEESNHENFHFNSIDDGIHTEEVK